MSFSSFGPDRNVVSSFLAPASNPSGKAPSSVSGPSSPSGKTPSSVSGKQNPAQAISDGRAKLDALREKMNKAQSEVTSAKVAQTNGSSKIADTFNAAMKKASDDQAAAMKKASDDQNAAFRAISESFRAAQKTAGDAATAEKTKLQKGVDDANVAYGALIKEQTAVMDELNMLMRQQMPPPLMRPPPPPPAKGGRRTFRKKRRARGASRR